MSKPSKPSVTFVADGKDFKLHWSEKRNHWRVSCVDENWDYEDEAEADTMTTEVRHCASFEDACIALGV
jgi:hypothetical protein